MWKIGVVLGVLLFSGAAQAGGLVCTGEVLGYHLVLRAKMSGARFTSKANVVISKEKEVLKQMNMRVTTSRFVSGQSLYFTAEDANGKIILNTSHSGGNRYSGNVDASGAQGSISVATVCTVR